MFEEILKQIPNQPQRQDSMMDQLIDLHRVAIALGMYDAADGLKACWNLDRTDLFLLHLTLTLTNSVR